MIVGQWPDGDDARGREQREQEPGEWGAPHLREEQRQAGRGEGNGRYPPDVERPQQQHDRGELEDGVGDAKVLVIGERAPAAPGQWKSRSN